MTYLPPHFAETDTATLRDLVRAHPLAAGAQAYISPNWYPSKHANGVVVPTWNYAALHAHGVPQAFKDADFGVESRWLGLLSLRVVATALRAFRKGFMPGKVDGPFHRTPADFLIDAQGRIAMAHYGKDIDDHIPLDTIAQWLRTQHP